MTRSDNALIITLNFAGVVAAYGLLAISLWLSTDVPLATKGYWGMVTSAGNWRFHQCVPKGQSQTLPATI